MPTNRRQFMGSGAAVLAGLSLWGHGPRSEGSAGEVVVFRNGVVLSLASARLLADLMLERAPILAPEAYAWRD